MTEVGKTLLVVGLGVAVIGLLLWLGGGRGWFGKLPGDVIVTRGHTTFYFPVVTCLLLSALLSLVMWLFRR